MEAKLVPTVGKQPPVLHESPHYGLFDSFSWLDEDDDLDLRLTFDDCHADRKPPRPVTSAGPPSLFRRRLSVNKLSFSRASPLSSRPATKDDVPAPEQAPVLAHARRKSRALSLITPKHGPQPSIASVDSAAAYYQDPEARHKLRTYLASPQKFDEALAFGFPADNVCHVSLPGTVPRSSNSFSRGLFMASSEKLRTFLADDNSSTYSEGTSIPDSESPRTPHSPENQLHSIKPFDLPSHSPVFPPKFSEGYAQVPPTFREMTLRLTLTRPDLRSCEEEPYGLSNGLGPRQSSLSRSRPRLRPFRVDSPVLTPGNDDATKENMNQIFADIDRELSSSPEGVVKRFWNRVRRG